METDAILARHRKSIATLIVAMGGPVILVKREKNDVNAHGKYTVQDVQTKSRVNARTVRISLLNALLIIVVRGALSPYNPIF